MKTAVKPDLKLRNFFVSKSYTPQIEKENSLINYLKFYQKLFVILIAFSIILIFPESSNKLGNICEIYNSRKACLIW